MQKEKTIQVVVGFIVVIIFIGALVYASINKKVTDDGAVAQVQNSQPQNTNTMEDTNTSKAATPSEEVKGVKITVLKEGSGEVAKSGDTVAMNYTGRLTDGTVFDSNIDPKFQHVEPFVFTLGAGMVIQGWDIGVAGMKVGEKRNLLIEPQYGYGASGAGKVIPPNAVLDFDVELVAIKK